MENGLFNQNARAIMIFSSTKQGEQRQASTFNRANGEMVRHLLHYCTYLRLASALRLAVGTETQSR